MPETVAAAPAAPSSTPASPSTPTPSSAPPSPAPVAAPVSAPATPPAAAPETAAPAVAAPASKPEPKQADFPGDIEGFLNAHREWENEGGEPAVEEPAKTEEVKVEDQAAEVKPVEDDEPVLLDEPEQVTPEVLNGWLDKSPALKQAFEESPELKNQLFAMARTNAKAAPMLEIFPNVDSAKFAAETSNKFVGMRTGFLQSIENPESFGDVFDQFAQEFVERNADGTPQMDAEGNPIYGEDFHMMNNFIVDAYHDTEIADLEAALQANRYTSDEQRDNDDMALQALKFVKALKAGAGAPAKPDLANASPEVKAYFDQKEREIAEREAKLNADGKAQTKEQKAQARQAYEQGVSKKIGGAVGKRLDMWMKEKNDAGVFIPSVVTDTKDPKTGISIFAQTLFNQFQEKTFGRKDQSGKIIGGVAHIRNHMAQLEMLPPSAESEKQRVDYVLQLIDEHLQPILDKNLRQIQNKEIEDSKKRRKNTEAREKLANREPTGGSAPAPQAIGSDEAAYAKATQEVDQKFPDLSGVDRLSKILTLQNKYLSR